MSNPVVSVVVPCYNVEKKIGRLLESLSHQTYKALQLIFINDGSEDQTEKVILSYKDVFCQLGMEFILKSQENTGPGAAVEAGFKLVTGSYFIWPDADDWLTDNSIEIRVDFLEKHSEYACVASDVAIFNENDLNKSIGKISKGRNYLYDENQFENILRYKAVFNPGPYMIRMSDMDRVNPNRYLFPSRTGQNVQLLMPISYKMKRAYIDIPLYNYVIYQNSLSRKDYATLDKGYDTFDKLKTIYEKTLDNIEMPEEEKEGYRRIIFDANIEQKYYFAIEHRDFVYEKELYRMLEQREALTPEITRIHRQRYLWWLKKLYHMIKR